MEKPRRVSPFRPQPAWIAAALTILVVLAGLGWYLRQEASESPLTQSTGPTRGSVANIAHPRPAPQFELKQSNGKMFRLADFKGNAVVVHFWASWCPPCLAEIPEWLEFADRWKGKPVRFVAVSLDQAWPDALRILPDSRLPGNVMSVLDQEQKLPDQFGTYQYPETYLLDSQQRIVSKWVGAQNWNSTQIKDAIEAAMPAQGR
jgi:thiol-disulfide isomerase/thioredoxin